MGEQLTLAVNSPSEFIAAHRLLRKCRRGEYRSEEN
jgi:hypothetical protein